MKHFWRTFLLILGSLFILDAIIVGFTITINFGIIAISLIGALYFLAGLFHDHVYSRKRKTTRIWIGATLLLIHTLLLAFFAFIAYFGRSDTIARDADAVIVLGTALNGEQVSPSLQSRLDATIEYVSENPAAKIVVTGGKGYGEDITQALAMQRYLISYGIPDSSILMGFQTALFSWRKSPAAPCRISSSPGKFWTITSPANTRRRSSRTTITYSGRHCPRPLREFPVRTDMQAPRGIKYQLITQGSSWQPRSSSWQDHRDLAADATYIFEVAIS